MVNKTWQLVEQHGYWWAYEGTTHSRSGHLPIVGPFPSCAMAQARLQRHLSGRSPEAPANRSPPPRRGLMSPLILKRASASRPPGEWDHDDYDALENGVVVGCIFFLDAVDANNVGKRTIERCSRD